jgi:electron transfer flavoprotein alpha subunit
MSIRTSTFDAAGEGGSRPGRERSAPRRRPGLSEWVEDKVAATDRPELTSAGIVVSGGRGVGSKRQFA